MIRASEQRTLPAPATRGDHLPKHAAPGEPLEMLDFLAEGIVLAERLAGIVGALHSTEFMPAPNQASRHLGHLDALQRELKLAYAELAVVDPDDSEPRGIDAAMQRWREAVAPTPIKADQPAPAAA